MRLSAVQFVIFFFFAACGVVGSPSDKPSSIRFSGVPALGFDPDNGFGFGAVGAMYVDKENYRPYQMALGLKVYLTTKGVNSHAIQLDQVRAFGLPLRLTTRLGFFSTIAQNYCGPASDAQCAMRDAEFAAAERVNEEREKFINHYYQNRFMSFFGHVASRWLLWQGQAKLELMLAYRGNYYLTGDFKHRGPYEDSLYQKDYLNQKTDGYLSTLELGLMLDKRDNEPAPTSGYWLETSARGGSFLIGSAWDYFGSNAALRFYFPLDDDHRLVIASQTIADVIVGDLPFDAISRIGGSQALSDYTAIGGQHIGRGIREQRYVGRIKFIEQGEFRYNFWSFSLLRQQFDLNGAVMADLGMTAWDFSRFTKDMQHVYLGFGGGLRIYWNKTFVIRGDLGVSPNENFSPKFYLVVGNVF
ncbi:MAG TPA: BamA/TamA family outer membrane protein [Myxococcota bacterium]|nr:BamA/TamA family outer membrane protein [Myxococcota bacterium]